ncbi:MAG: serine hydrolase domain-containing protein [Bacteroides sp.]|nr:serine hydrolase domain-containing protein [Bacteroides sp.]
MIIIITCNRPKRQEAAGFFKTREVVVPEVASLTRKAEWIDSIFTRLSRGHWFNGAIIYAEKGHVIYKNAFGLCDFYAKDTLSTNSAFQLASVSKMFTAMAIMILREDGSLDYDDSIQVYIPEFPYHGVTIRQLLTHRSGLSRYMSLAHEKWHNKDIPMGNDDMLGLFMKYQPKPYFKPDNGFHYCNTNYAMLASVVEKVSGKPFDVFVQERIFDPLEMHDSFIYQMREDTAVPAYIPSNVYGHRYRKWRPIRQRNDYLNGIMGDKGVYASVEDLFKFDRALDLGMLVGDSTLNEAFASGSPSYWRRTDNYGFGWRIKTTEDSTVYHFGWWKGFRAYYIRDMRQEKTIIALCNKDKGPGSSILWDIIRDTTHKVAFNNFLASDIAIEGMEN